MSGVTEDAAYTCLKIEDKDISDYDVVASFYALHPESSSEEAQPTVGKNTMNSSDALEIIAKCRRSRLLHFVLLIVPHLNERNVAVLTSEPQLPEIAHELTPSWDENPAPGLGAETTDLTQPTGTDPTQVNDSSLPNDGKPSQNEPNLTSGVYRNDVDMEDSSSYDKDSAIEAESSSSADIPSDSDDAMENFSEFSQERETYHDGQKWRCKQCSEPLYDCRCNGEESAHPCVTCGLPIDQGYCAQYCSNCHGAAGVGEGESLCSGCLVAETSSDNFNGSEELSELFWDPADNIWRCALCFWEVEANNSEEGFCHCQIFGPYNGVWQAVAEKRAAKDAAVATSNEQKVEKFLVFARGGSTTYTPNRTTVRRIELPEYPDFSPADSDSSVADSSDEEPNSGDDEFIEDDGPFVSGLATLVAGNYDPFVNSDSPVMPPMDVDQDTESLSQTLE